MYLNGKTTWEISETVKVSTRQVRNVLNNRGIVLKENRRTGGYQVNVDFFKTWSSKMAYVIGFVFTDGNVCGNALTIAQDERYILELIKSVMGANYKITRRPNGKNDIYTLVIHRKEIVEDLRNLGVVEGKSRIIKFPNVPDEYLSHFVRGVIDGDGWIQDRGYVMNVTNASESFSCSLHKVFNSRGYNGRIDKPTKHANAYRVWVSGKNDVIKLADWVYRDADDLFLKRKQARFFVNVEEKIIA